MNPPSATADAPPADPISESEAPVSYSEVLNYYAKQMQALDAGDFQAYAETFTQDGVFRHTPNRPPASTRAGIVAELREFHRRFDDDPQQRRHLFTMVHLEPGTNLTIRCTAYALVLTTRPGGLPEFVRNCVLHDELVVLNGELFTRKRSVDHDGALL